MIDYLKDIHRLLYLPRTPAVISGENFKVVPINEPYLYVDRNCHIDEFDEPQQLVRLAVFNVGGGTLKVNSVRIPPSSKTWLKRTQSQGSEEVNLIVSLKKDIFHNFDKSIFPIVKSCLFFYLLFSPVKLLLVKPSIF